MESFLQQAKAVIIEHLNTARLRDVARACATYHRLAQRITGLRNVSPACATYHGKSVSHPQKRVSSAFRDKSAAAFVAERQNSAAAAALSDSELREARIAAAVC
jgi:hypothetical protein